MEKNGHKVNENVGEINGHEKITKIEEVFIWKIPNWSSTLRKGPWDKISGENGQELTSTENSKNLLMWTISRGRE